MIWFVYVAVAELALAGFYAWMESRGRRQEGME